MLALYWLLDTTRFVLWLIEDVDVRSDRDADEERRERVRGEEQMVRLTRSIYMLSLRVRQLQQDVNQTLAACTNLSQPSKVRHHCNAYNKERLNSKQTLLLLICKSTSCS